jgi:membrane-bound serine protease (ClpP class)
MGSRSRGNGLRLFLLALVLLGPVFSVGIQSVRAQTGAPLVLSMDARGALTPAMQSYVERGIRQAQDQGAELIILQLDTPGGAINTMNAIIEAMRSSSVPIAVYVAPQGAMAASAGTLITLAGHVAAMAPETAIGAASPVGAQGEDIATTEEQKTKEILKATARSLAAGRSPQAIALAEAAIDQAKAASASEALQAGLVDLVANDQTALLSQLDGRTVTVLGQPRTLHTAGATVQPFGMSLIESLLSLLTDPNIVFVLMSLGVLLILTELAQPGGWVAGLIGTVLLLISVYGMGILSANWFGLIFVVLAIILVVMELHTPTHGALAAAALGCFIAGALVLFNSTARPAGYPALSLPLLIGLSLALAGGTYALILAAVRAQTAPIRSTRASLAGATGTAQTDIAPSGVVQVASEQWTADLAPGEPPIPAGELVIVAGTQGLRLLVRRASSPGPAFPAPRIEPAAEAPVRSRR